VKNYLKVGKGKNGRGLFFFDDTERESFKRAYNAAMLVDPRISAWRRMTYMPDNVRCIGHAPQVLGTALNEGTYNWVCANCDQTGVSKIKGMAA
jgi:hypothetical protein